MIPVNNIQLMNLPEPKFIIKDHISDGLGILAGPPKIGKTNCVLSVCLDYALNKLVLGKLIPNADRCIYISCEETLNSIYFKVDKLLENRQIERQQQIDFFIGDYDEMKSDFAEPKTILMDMIEDYIDQGCKFIIVDPLVKFLSSKNLGSTSFVSDYQFLSDIQNLAIAKSVCVLFIHHTKKSKTGDIFDDILGSRGVTASPDTLIVLHDRSSNKATLSFRGRYIAEKHYNIIFDEVALEWTIIDEVSREIDLTPERQAIVNLLENSYPEGLSTSTIAAQLSKHQSTISILCKKLLKSGVLKYGTKYGMYILKKPGDKDDNLPPKQTHWGTW